MRFVRAPLLERYRITEYFPFFVSQQDQALIFCDGQLKAGGQREVKGRQRKRPHQALLVPGNHFLPGAFFQPEPIEHEDGELTRLEVMTQVKHN